MENLPNPGTMMDTVVLERHLNVGVRTLAILAKRTDISVDSLTSVRSLGLKRKELRRWAENYFGFRLSQEDRRKPFKTIGDFQNILVAYEDKMSFFAPHL